jgi:hypothetical protein
MKKKPAHPAKLDKRAFKQAQAVIRGEPVVTPTFAKAARKTKV